MTNEQVSILIDWAMEQFIHRPLPPCSNCGYGEKVAMPLPTGQVRMVCAVCRHVHLTLSAT